MSTDRRSAMRSIAGGTVLLGTVGVLALPGMALDSVPVEEFRITVPELGGYTAEALSSPISVQLFEPVIPVPAEPGQPHGEMHGSYSRATLSSGPTSRGLGSAIWPGATVGDGLSAFDPRIPAYPFKASATYPDGPYESLGDAGNPETDRGDPNTHTGMFAYARGIDVYGESNGGGELIPTLVQVGNISTISTNTVVEGVVVAETIATISDLSIGGGLITMDGLQTRLIARSNGEVAETDGAYEISGLEVMGVGYEFTEEGIVPSGTDDVPYPLVIPIGLGGQGLNLRELIGIEIEAAPIEEQIDGPTGSRTTRGVIITVDTTPLRQAAGAVPLNDLIGMIEDPIGQDIIPCDSLPPEFGALPCFSNPINGLKANLYTISALSPEFRFLLGGGQVKTSASLPFNYTPPPLPTLPPTPPIGTTPTITTPVYGGSPSFTPSPVAPQAPVVAAPTTSAPTQQLVALAIPEGLSRGLDLGLAVLSFASIGLIARGGRKLTMAAMYGTNAPNTVGAGAVPDLRAFARGEEV